MPYFPYPTVATYTDYLIWLNTVTGGWFWTMIGIFVVFGTFFMALKYEDTGKSIIAAGFISTLTGTLLAGMGLVSPALTIIVILITVAAFITVK